jgi:ketosteroid isomerase-like protein
LSRGILRFSQTFEVNPLSTPWVPEPIERFVVAVNRGDTEAFLAFFPEDGGVDDLGRRFEGHDAIRAWSDREFVGANGTMTPQAETVRGDAVDVRAGWKSEHHSGDSRFTCD